MYPPYASVGCSALLVLLPFCTQEKLANAPLPFRDMLAGEDGERKSCIFVIVINIVIMLRKKI